MVLNLAASALPASARDVESRQNISAQDLLIKSEVETAVSMLQGISQLQQQGQMTLEQAKKLGADLLRELKYGEDGYFWAHTTEGINVVMPGRKEIEGMNRLEMKDVKGKFYVKEMIAKATAGGGYLEYWYPKKGETDAKQKRSYVLPFKPFGWLGRERILPLIRTFSDPARAV